MKKALLTFAALLLASGAFALDRTLTFTWEPNDANDNVTYYSLERSPDGQTYAEIKKLTIPATALELQDTLTGGSGTYFYQLRAANSWGISEPSNVVPVNTAVPGAPGSLNIKVIVDVTVP